VVAVREVALVRMPTPAQPLTHHRRQPKVGLRAAAPAVLQSPSLHAKRGQAMQPEMGAAAVLPPVDLPVP
jgi:hypothetical protein